VIGWANKAEMLDKLGNHLDSITCYKKSLSIKNVGKKKSPLDVDKIKKELDLVIKKLNQSK